MTDSGPSHDVLQTSRRALGVALSMDKAGQLLMHTPCGEVGTYATALPDDSDKAMKIIWRVLIAQANHHGLPPKADDEAAPTVSQIEQWVRTNAPLGGRASEGPLSLGDFGL